MDSYQDPLEMTKLDMASPPVVVLDKTVAIIGTGDYARALAKNFLKAGYKVYCGSRDPRRRNFVEIDSSLANVKIVSITECVRTSDVIFLCAHVEAHESILKPLEQELKGKIVVDISNPVRKVRDISNAEKVQKIIPGSYVIKAFNTISAYNLESEVPTNQAEVQICGDNPAAKAKVEAMVRDMGFTSSNCGGLHQAMEVENKPLYLFQGWGSPALIALVVCILWTIFAIVRLHVYEKHPWSDFPVYSVNKILGCNALTLLALCFLPGSFAAILQMCYGTKYRRFPGWMDCWLKGRKQLGLFALLSAAIHACTSVILFQPGYFPWFYTGFSGTVPANTTQDATIAIMPKIDARGGGVILAGALALTVMSVQGITSIPAVGKLLNWREWRFVQSHLGYLCLFLAAVHATTLSRWNFDWFPLVDIFATMSFCVLPIPYLALLFKILLSLPCIDAYVWKIRRGHERGVKYDVEARDNPRHSSHRVSDKYGNGHVNGSFDKDHMNNAWQQDIPMSNRMSNGSSVVIVT